MGDRKSNILPSELNPGERMVVQLAALLADAGGDVLSILREAGVAGSVVDFTRGGLLQVPQERLHKIRDRLMRNLAVLLAARAGREVVRYPDWQILFFCLVNCRTLREALARGCDVVTVMDGRCGRMSLEAGPANAEFRIESLWSERSVQTFAIDALSVASFIDIFGWLIARPLPVLEVVFDYPVEMLDRFDPVVLPKPISMNSGRTGFIFPSAYLDYPVTRTTEDCETGIGKTLAAMFDLRSEDLRPRLVERCRRIMYRGLRDHGELPSPDELCTQLGCSKSQLRRWLAQDDMSYNAIKESCRRELALDLLRRSNLSIEDIATRLDFADSDAFRKAFRQWTRLSPTEFRKEHPPATAQI